MRISDWSSDVCSSDLPLPRHEQRAAIEEARQRVGVGKVSRALFGLSALDDFAVEILVAAPAEEDQRDIEYQRGGQRAVGSAADADQRADRRLPHGDRKSVVSGKSVSVRVDIGGRSII